MGVNLSQADVQDLKKQGFSEQEIQKALVEIEEEELSGTYQDVQQKRSFDPRQNSQLSAFATKSNDDIIRWQLELNDILERAEHILRGDIPKFVNGQVVWNKNPNPELNALNSTGVNEIMKILAMYVNRNTILSDYTNDEINVKVYDFGRAVNNLIFMRSDEFGMDTREKNKNYEIIVRELVDIVHSAYKRALDGAEKRSLREMISVSQSTATSSQLGNGVTINASGQQQRERGLLNPMRYIKGKYTS
jgi:hypothetical protein